MKLGFITCVQLGLNCMQAIYEEGAKLSLVITLPDNQAIKKSGRVFLDDFCEQYHIPLIKSLHVNDSTVVNAIKQAKIDWLFIIGWSQIAGAEVLSAPRQGVFGIHPTLLPTGRGRAAIPWTILKGLDQTGVTLFKMDEGIDTGAIAAQHIVKLTKNETAESLYAKVNEAHIQIIQHLIPQLFSNQLDLVEQDELQATNWPQRKPEDGKLNLFGSVYDAERLVRAVTHPYPGAFYFENDKKVIIWKARVSKQILENMRTLKFNDGYLIVEEFELIDG